MTDIKTLPENLKELEQSAEFKRVYKNHTIEDIEAKLDNANVGYLSADNKNDLTWRLMDAQGLFSPDATDATDVTDAPPTVDDTDVPAVTEPVATQPSLKRVSVKNTSSFNVLEPSTTTLMLAGKITHIDIAAGKTKAQVISNIKQFNRTRGNILHIVG